MKKESLFQAQMISTTDHHHHLNLIIKNHTIKIHFQSPNLFADATKPQKHLFLYVF